MKYAIVIISGVVIVGYAIACAAIFVFQRSFLYFPQPRSVTASEATMVLAVDGAELVVTVRPHDGPNAIVYFGGNGEDVAQNLASFSHAFPHHAIFLMHYRGYGGSSGKPSEKANIADALALVEAVRARHPDIALLGRSLGSGVAVQVASRVGASRLVLITPFDSIIEIGTEIFWYFPIRWLLSDTYESGKFAGSITIPTTLIEAENDEVIPHASTEKLLSRFKPGVATRTIIKGVGHNDLKRSNIYIETLQAALK